MRSDAGDPVVRNKDVDVFLFVGAGPLPKPGSMDQEFLLWLCVGKCEVHSEGRDGFR